MPGGIAPETARTARAVIDETGFTGKVDLVAVERSEPELAAIQHAMEAVLREVNAGAPVTVDAVAHVPTGTIDVDRPKDAELTPAQTQSWTRYGPAMACFCAPASRPAGSCSRRLPRP